MNTEVKYWQIDGSMTAPCEAMPGRHSIVYDHSLNQINLSSRCVNAYTHMSIARLLDDVVKSCLIIE